MTESRNLLSERLEEFLTDCVKTIHNRVGKERIVAIVLGGSFGSGEGTFIGTGNGLEILSDFDIYLVVKTPDDLLEISPRRKAIARECERNDPDMVFYGGVHIGVATVGDLRNLPPSPGIYQLKYRSRVLYGDGEVLNAIPEINEGSIDGREAVFLLENRMASLLSLLTEKEEPWGSGYRLKLAYGFCRAYTDIAIAVTIVGSSFIPGYEERLRFLENNFSSNAKIKKFIDGRVLEKIGLATRAKIEPEKAFDELTGKVVGLDEAARDIFEVWRRIYEDTTGKSVDISRGRMNVEPLSRSNALDSLKSWLIFVKPMGFARAARILLERNFSCLFYSPFDLVRFSAVKLIFHYLAGGIDCEVVPEGSGFPYSKRQWKGAAEEVKMWWDRMVHGE